MYLRLHTLIITQPIVTSGAVAKPNSSAPSIAAISNITSAHKLTVCLIRYTLLRRPFMIRCLMCFCKSKLPRKSCIVDRVFRSCTSTAIITRDQDNLCSRFCYTSCNCADACFRYQALQKFLHLCISILTSHRSTVPDPR